MSNEVYANGNEVSCKAAAGKSICAFPDVCFTPPLTPATPPGVPIPYPNTGMASDTSGGSKTVQISGSEVMKKDSSYFKQSTGDEAGSAPKKNVITSKIKGKCYYTAWSMDVKIEGENVVRHLDMMTHNHASGPGGTPPWVYQDMMAAKAGACEAQEADEQTKCAGATPHSSGKGLNCPPGCAEAKACILKPKSEDKDFCCHPNTTGHHLVEVHCFTNVGARSGQQVGKNLHGLGNYREQRAPCVCASESASTGTHKLMHDVQGKQERAYGYMRRDEPLAAWGKGRNEASYWNYAEAREAGVAAHKKAFPHCNSECTRRQLDEYHKGDPPAGAGVDDDTALRSDLQNRH